MNTIMKTFTLLVLFSLVLHADLKTDLLNINNKMQELNSSVSTVEISSESMCAPLIALNKETKVILESLNTTNDSITTPIVIDEELLALLQELFINSASVSGQTLLLSNQITTLVPNTNPLVLADGITALLQLSSDIGVMADSIGAMADNILVMADNIGTMADRILEVQVVQSENLISTQNNVLLTQNNTLALVSVVETQSYNADINALIFDGDVLIAKMMMRSLNIFTMASTLDSVEEDVQDYLVKVTSLQDLIKNQSQTNTMYVDPSTLNSLVTLSLTVSSITSALDGYMVRIEALQNFTRKRTLSASLESMLSMSADISTMSNTVLEMSNLVLVMSDNIGLAANEIVLTQQLQSTNITTVQSLILSIQTITVSIFASL